jgi:methylthioribose-1-phosphate isomerase
MKPYIKTLWWENNNLYIIDQQKLPSEETVLQLKTVKDVWNAIQNLQIRGAPAIGCVASFGVVLSAINSKTSDIDSLREELKKDIKYLSKSRPTAYNLFYALERMENLIHNGKHLLVKDLKQSLLEEAKKIYSEDLQCCYNIGINGAKLIKEGTSILTHCNAGALATSGIGTALAPMFVAKKKNIRFNVYVDETRPVLQGARLTAWELKKAKIPYTLICDNMAGHLMHNRKIDMVITGADRIAINGDTANKIGTYALAILAHYHKIPFYIAAPSSTFDKNIKNGQDIIIEERSPEEIQKIGNTFISPKDAPVFNPAFDVTPAKFIKAFITENGIIEKM